MRSSLVAISGLVLGAIVGGTIANGTIPSHEQMREFAADLVVPGPDPTSVGEVSGLEMFVGQYEAIAGFHTRGDGVAAVSEALREHAEALGWTLARIEPRPAGEQQFWTREQARATISIRNSEVEEDGTIFVRYAASPTDRFYVGLFLGAGVGLILAFLLLRCLIIRRTRNGENQLPITAPAL